MTDQNMVKGDAVFPNHLVANEITIEGNASPLSFLKGELATIDSSGFLVKLTSTKIGGIVQVRNAITGGLAGDDLVSVTVNRVGTRILVSLPVNAKKGDLLQINGSDGTGNLVVSVATVDTAELAVGRLFGLYKNTGLVAAAADLGLVDLGVF